MRYDIRRFTSVTSTMDVCRQLAEQGAPEGVVVLADEQTTGRGRAGRTWYSPAGQAIYLSLLLRPSIAPRRLSWLTMIGALAVLDALDELQIPPSRATLKWANDVMLDGKKLAGVLVEAAFAADRLEYAVLGIGLNVNTRFEDAPATVRAQAISLQQAMGRPFDLQSVLDLLLAALDKRYAQLSESPLPAYVARLETLGQQVRLRGSDEDLIGIATQVEEDGTLVVSTSSGERRVAFGDLLSA
jgi:BirA family biotin operon repressor/biotin-[acetyl-CoA-carboxylase] ligase